MALLEVAEFDETHHWTPDTDIRARSGYWCDRLESGDILYFPATPFAFSASDREFLCTAEQSSSVIHKNISYRPGSGLLRGVSASEPARRDRVAQIMRDYSQHATDFLKTFFQPYASGFQMDYASFRPIEEANRPNSLAQAQRPPPRRCLPHATHARRPHPPHLHQRQPTAGAALGRHHSVPATG